MRGDSATGVVARAIGAVATVIALGTLPALATPTPTPEPSPTGSPLPTPSDGSPTPVTTPSVAPTVDTAPATGSSADPGEPSMADEPGSRRPPTTDDDGGIAARRTAEASVAARDDRFVPVSISVEVGTTVTWRNEGQNPHTVTANDRAFDSGTLEPGDPFQTTFQEVGTVAYYCQIHGEPGSGMIGTVEVVAASEGPTEEPAVGPTEDGQPSSTDDQLAPTGAGAVVPAMLAIATAIVGAIALRVGSRRGKG